jgi:hypothetical protein
MAFIETYKRVVAESKNSKPKYVVSLGHDRNGRADPIIRGVEQGKLAVDKASKYLPDLSYDGKDALRLERVIEKKTNQLGISTDKPKSIDSAQAVKRLQGMMAD